MGCRHPSSQQVIHIPLTVSHAPHAQVQSLDGQRIDDRGTVDEAGQQVGVDLDGIDAQGPSGISR